MKNLPSPNKQTRSRSRQSKTLFGEVQFVLNLRVLMLSLSLLIGFVAKAQKPTAVIKKAATAPIIDGYIDDVWADAIAYNIEKSFQGENPSIGSTSPSTWKALWTGDGIYILIQVNDDVFSPSFAGNYPVDYWMYDQPEIYFDVNSVKIDGKGASSDGSGNGSGHYQFAPHFLFGQISGGIASTEGSNGCLYSFNVTNPTYNAEYFIPFTKLIDQNGGEVAKSKPIGFDIYISDNDTPDLNRNRAVWANTGAIGENWNNMDEAGIITLEGAPDRIYVDNITLTGGSIITDNGTLQMIANISPTDAEIKKVNWSVINKSGMAIIDSNGLLKAVKNGTVSVIATATDGSQIEASADVEISGQLINLEDVWNDLNLIKNWNYNEGLSSWGGWIDNGVANQLPPVVEDGVVAMKVGTSPESWHYQHNQNALRAESNIPYILQFKSWATADAPAVVDFEDTSNNNYNRYGASTDPQSINGRSEWYYNLTTVPTWYTFHVTFDQILPTTDQKVQWLLSLSNETIYLDSVLLVKETDYRGFSVNQNTVNIGSDGNGMSVNITGNVDWTVSNDQTWLTVYPASGSGDGQLTFSATQNTGAERIALVKVNSQGYSQIIKVIQSSGLEVSSNSARIEAAEGSTASVNVIANVDWTASCDQSWLTISPKSGTGSQTLTFTAEANPSNTTARTANIMVSAPGIPSKTIVVTQAFTIDPTLMDAFEPDNSMEFASVILPNAVQEHNIYPIGDVDYASFELINAPARIDIKFTTDAGGRQLQLFDAYGNFWGQGADLISTSLSQNGTYYIRAWNPEPDQITLKYNLLLNITPILPDAFEPDNSMEQASVIKPGVLQQHSISPVGDVDYASFELTNAPAEVSVQFLSETGGKQLQIIDNLGNTLSQNYDYSNLILTQNGKYYIRAWNTGNQLMDSYQLSLSIKPIIVDKYEPDNTWEQATEILPFFEQDDHTIKSWGDVDFLKFTINDAPRTVYVDVYDTRSNYCNSFGVWLFDRDGTSQLNYTYTQGQRCGYSRLEQTITTNGTYYVKVAVPLNEGGIRDNYTIKVTTDGAAPVIACNEGDRAALVAIYNALNGVNWNRKEGWLTDNVMNWQGVTLNPEGRVVKLNLTQNNLRGTIPPEIGNLTALRYLNLGNQRYVDYWSSRNNLNGTVLPATLANLINLEVLSLDYLNLYTELPDIFSGMVNLRELYLDNNYFTNTQLPLGIQSCNKLERLFFQFNNFSQLFDLTSLTNIQDVQAYSNRLTFEDIEPNIVVSNFNYSDQAKIGQSLGLNPETGSTVTHTIEVGGVNNICQWYKDNQPILGQNTNTLTIANVSIADAGIYQLKVTNSLATQLTLYSEPITMYQKELPIYKALEAFYNSTGGTNWNKNTNWLSDEPLTSWFGINQNQYDGSYRLEMYSNNLVGQLPSNMGDLILFTHIYINDNRKLTGIIPESIGNITQLLNLQLSNNGLTGEIPSSIGNLKNLSYFNVANNQLSGSVPASIINCTNLNTIRVNNNQIENLPDLSVFPQWLSINVVNNMLQFDDIEPTYSGEENMDFYYDPQKKFGVALSLNPEAGTLFTHTFEVGGANNIYQWYKNNQPIVGQTSNTLSIENINSADAGIYELRVTNTMVPELILSSEPITLYQKEMPIYKALEAFYNSTGGPNWYNNTNWLSDEPITSWFGIMKDQYDGTYRMRLYNNNLIGQLPANMGDLTLFYEISIGTNPLLTGSIPESIGNLVQLGDFTLYDCGITGKIPSSIGNLVNLYYLSLNGNQLTGPVPSSLVNCSKLNYLYLYNNNLDYLPNLTSIPYLYELNVYNNRFEFDDLQTTRTGKPNLYFNYNPQKRFGQVESFNIQTGENLTLTASVGGSGNLYQWFKNGTLLEEKTDNKLIFESILLTDQGTYTCKVTNPDVPNLVLESMPYYVSVKLKPSNFIPDWTGVGNNVMKINIVTASLDGFDLQYGDEIGIFDGIKCVGVAVVTETINQNNILQIMVSADNGSGNGFTPGNSISYKIYDASENVETNGVNASYYNQNPLWSTDGKFTELATSYIKLMGSSTTNQFITLNKGWNIISAHLIPTIPNMNDLLQPIINAGQLRKVMDEKGLVVEDFGSFGGWRNNIGSWLPTEGYKVNVSQTTTLAIEGSSIQLPMEINLAPGWNIISYPSALQQDAMNTFQALITSGKLKKVINESGQALEDFGAYGGWKNNMGNLQPGRGYKVNVTSPCSISIQAGGTKSAIILPELLASDHFQKIYVGNGFDHMNINIVDLSSGGLKLDDEIGIFDGDNCVGSAKIGVDQLAGDQISIAASSNDELGEAVNGFIPGRPITIKLFRDKQEYILSTETLNNTQGIFAKGESLFAKVSMNTTTGFNNFDSSLAIKCYPNPFSQLVNIDLNVPKNGEINVSIYNSTGQLVKVLIDGNVEAGPLKLIWYRKGQDEQNVTPGIYTCRIIFNQSSTISKLIVR